MYNLVKVVITIGNKQYYPVRNGNDWLVDVVKDINDIPPVRAEYMNKIVESLSNFEYTVECIHARM